MCEWYRTVLTIKTITMINHNKPSLTIILLLQMMIGITQTTVTVRSLCFIAYANQKKKKNLNPIFMVYLHILLIGKENKLIVKW